MYSNNIEIGANMFNLVWKEQSTKRWIITFSDNYGELHQGRGDNRPEWFSTRREALKFLEENFSEEVTIGCRTRIRPPRTYVYRRANRSYGFAGLHRFDWSNNWNYLEGAK